MSRICFKNITRKIFVVFSILIYFLSTFVLGVEVEKSKKNEYTFGDIGMKILLDNSFIDRISLLKDEPNLENKEQILSAYEKSGILANFINKDEKIEILVMSKINSFYRDMPNLKMLPDEDIIKLKDKFVQTIGTDDQFEIKEDKIIRTNNYNCFIKITTALKQEENILNMNIYYTIMNGRLITISFRTINNKNIENLQNDIIESIKFFEVERPKYVSAQEKVNLVIGFTLILTLILFIAIFFIRRKDKKIFNNNIKDKETKQYSKFGGLLIFFWMLCFYQIILKIVEISDISNITNNVFYKNCTVLQDAVVSLISIYLIYIIVKRKNDTPKKVIKANMSLAIFIIFITVIRIIYVLINPGNIYIDKYIQEELNMLSSNIIYSFIWIVYFEFSKRVKIYYYLPVKTVKEILINSKIYTFLANRKSKRNERKNS